MDRPVDIFQGWPVIPSEAVPPGQVRVGGWDGDPPRAVYAHPTVVYGMRIVQAEPERRTFDPWVMEVASLMWQQDLIDRAAERAERRLDQLMRQQDMQRLLRMEADELRDDLWRGMMDRHPGIEHTWRRDLLRLTATCEACGVALTYEMAARLGIELETGRPRGHLSILVGDEWHEVKGVGELSVQFEVDTSAFDRAMGAR